MAPKISPCLWFDGQAEEAAKFYLTVFKNSKILNTAHYSEAGHDTHKRPAGSVMTVSFELDGTRFTALNGGPQFKFDEAISFEIDCKDQKEIDYYWDKLAEGGGSQGPCGWLKDRFGVSWQVVPRQMQEWMLDKDQKRADRVMEAMLEMSKLDIAALQKAHAGK